MADGLTTQTTALATVPDATKIATDDAGLAGHVQIIKLAVSADGSATVIPADGTAGLKVDLGADNDVVVSDGGGSVTVDNPTISVVGGGVEATAQRVTIANDSTGVLSVDDNGGTLSVDDGAGSLTVDNTVLSVVGGGTEAAAQRVTIANDSTGVVSVDDNGASLTVDGSVSLAAAIPAGTNNIGDVDVLSLPAIPAGNNNIGDVDVASIVPGTGATNQGKAEDAAHTSGDTGVYALGVRDDDPAVHSGTDGDYESLHVSAQGGLWSSEVATAAGGTELFRTLDADETEEEAKGTAGSLYGWYFYNDGAAEVYVKLYNATAANVVVGTTTPKMTIPVPAGSAANMAFPPGIKFDTAITIAATTGVADADTTAPAANQVVANLFYK